MYSEGPIVLVGGCDDNYALPLGVTLYSAISNVKDSRKVVVYVIDGGISDANKRCLKRVLSTQGLAVELEWVVPDVSSLDVLRGQDWRGQAAYLRLLIPDVLPEDCDKAIYLDSDLVVEADLSALWTERLAGQPALAVRDYWSPYVSCPDALVETYEELDISKEASYCNSGLMVVNAAQWREENLPSRVLEYMHRYSNYVKFADQDGLNAIIAGRWGLLDPKWNVALSALGMYGRFFDMTMEERKRAQNELLSNACVIHYTGTPKPWDVHYEGPAQDRFFHYLKESGWFNPAQYALWVLRRKARRAIAEGIPQDLRLRLRQWRHGTENT